ncbi:hypothetical protein WIW50_07805 [Flavobacteriaceae bacterium 3-367]
MMVGQSIKKRLKVISIVIIMIFCACEREECKIEISSTTHQYIDYFKTLKKIKKRDFLVKVTIDSTLSNHIGYRISTYPNLMDDDDEIPSEIDVYKDMKIVYLFNELSRSDEIKMKKVLLEQGFYSTSHEDIHSNYPEWVLLKNCETKCAKLIKDARYRNLKDLLVSSTVKND